MTDDLVTIDVRDGVADVRLNRPDKRNALDRRMLTALAEAGEHVGAAPGVRAVVVSGNGAGFCAGLDVSLLASLLDGRGAQTVTALLHREAGGASALQRPALVWKQVPVPTIAAVHGVALGGGLQIALGADVRFCAPDAQLSVLEVAWGIVPDMALTQTLRPLVPLDVAKELVLTGRTLSGTEAHRLGLVTHLADDPLAAATALAREIATRSPDAVRAGKRLLEESWHADAETGLALESQLQATLVGTPHQVEAVRANLEKRPPVFE